MIATKASDNINIAVARPFVLKIACRKGTIRNKAITAISLNLPDCFTDNLFLLENPICLEKSAVDAMGQIFLHTPMAMTKRNGATGIRIFQNK